MAEPNKPIDAFALASRQVPVFGFSKVEDLHKQFEITLVADEQKEASPYHHLHLKVKPDSIYKDDYSTIDFWIDKNAGTARQDRGRGRRGRCRRDLRDQADRAQSKHGHRQERIPSQYPRRVSPWRRSRWKSSRSEKGRPGMGLASTGIEDGTTTMVTGRVNENDFRDLVEKRAQPLLSLVSYLSQCNPSDDFLTRPLAGELLSQAMQVEEFLDTYDAGKCCTWCNLRSLTAAFKLFAEVGYELLHIRHRMPTYRLMPVTKDFAAATEDTLKFINGVLSGAAKETGGQGAGAESDGPLGRRHRGDVRGTAAHRPPAARLPGSPQPKPQRETVALLATAFLNLASESEDVRRGHPRQAGGIRPVRGGLPHRGETPQPRAPLPQPPVEVRHVRLRHGSGAHGPRTCPSCAATPASCSTC